MERVQTLLRSVTGTQDSIPFSCSCLLAALMLSTLAHASSMRYAPVQLVEVFGLDGCSAGLRYHAPVELVVLGCERLKLRRVVRLQTVASLQVTDGHGRELEQCSMRE